MVVKGSDLDVVSVIQGTVGWKQKFISYALNCFGGFYEKNDNIIEEAILCGKNETRYRFPYANPSCYMSSASDAYSLVNSVLFPNYEDVN